MKTIIGILICLASVILGLYLGVWICFIGGIVQVVNSCDPVNALGLAIGLVRIMSASVVGWISFIVTFSIGQAIL